MNYYLPNHHRSNSGATYFNYNDNIQVFSNKYTYNNRYTNMYKSSLYNQFPVKKNYVSEDSYDTPSNSNSDSDQEDNTSLSLKDKVFSPGDNDDNYYNENDIHNSSTLMSNNVSSDLSMSQSIIYNSNPMAKNKTKKTLILDLDETLVHSSFKPFYSKPDIHLRIQFKNEFHNVYVLKRPYVDNFLYQMSKLFNIIIFTASIPEYANPLLDRLDRNRVIKGRLFRENCTVTNGLYVKDLNILGKNLKDVIIIDNNPISYSVNKENGIPIKTWHYDKGDYELEKLVPFLTYLSGVEDVRRIIKRVVSRNEVNFRSVDDILSRVCLNNIENDQTDSYYPDDTKLVPRSQSMKNCSYMNQNKKMNNYNTISNTSNRNISIQGTNHNCSRKKEPNDNENRSLLHSMKVNKLKEEIINQINTTNPKINSSHTIEYLNYNRYNPSLYQNNNQDTIVVKSINSYNIKTPTNHSNNTLKTIDASSMSPTNAHYKTSYTFSPNRQLPRASSSYCVHKNYNNSSSMNTINAKLHNNYFQKSFVNPQITIEESKQNNLLKSTNIYPPKNYNTSSNPLYNSVNINKINKNASTIGTNNSNSSIFSKETNYYIKRKMMCRQQSVNNYSKKKCFFNTSAFSNLSNVSFYGNNTNNNNYLSGEKNISMYSNNNNGNTNSSQRTQSNRYLYNVNDRRFMLK